MNKQILALAIPNILTNLSVPLLGIVDTALMGRLDNLSYIGAIAIGSLIFNFIYWIFGFLRMGTTGFTAQAHGADNPEALSSSLMRPLSIATVIGVLIIILQIPLAQLGFYLIESSPEVETFAREYFFIRIWDAPATLMLYVLNGWFLGRQNARFPMYIAFLVNGVNIAANLYFVRVLNLNAAGVAWGTLIAQYMGLGLALSLFFSKYHVLKPYLWPSLRQGTELKRFFLVNSDIFIRTLCLLLTFGFFTAESARLGEDVLAVNTILLQFWTLMAYGIDGFAFAAESLVGNYLGSGQRNLLKKTIQRLFLWGMGLGVCFALSYLFFFSNLFSIFTDKKELLAQAMPYMMWVVLGPLMNTPCFIWDGIYIGATASVAMRNAMLISTLMVFFPSYWLLSAYLGNHALWVAMLCFMVSRGVTLSLGAKQHIFKAQDLKHKTVTKSA